MRVSLYLLQSRLESVRKMRAAVEVEAVARGLSARRLGLGIRVGLGQSGEVGGRSWERLWGQMLGMVHIHPDASRNTLYIQI